MLLNKLTITNEIKLLIEKYFPKSENIFPMKQKVQDLNSDYKLIVETAYDYLLKIKICHTKKQKIAIIAMTDNIKNIFDDQRNSWIASEKIISLAKIYNNKEVWKKTYLKYINYLNYIDSFAEKENYKIDLKFLEAVTFFSILHLWPENNIDINKILNFDNWNEKLGIIKELQKILIDSNGIEKIIKNLDNINSIWLQPVLKNKPNNISENIEGDFILSHLLIRPMLNAELKMTATDWYSFILQIAICKMNNITINIIGMYFPRYNYMYVKNIWEIYPKQNLDNFIKELNNESVDATSDVNNSENLETLKSKINHFFPKPLNTLPDIKPIVSYKKETSHASLTETAFDYLLRIKIMFVKKMSIREISQIKNILNQKLQHKENGWMATIGFVRLKQSAYSKSKYIELYDQYRKYINYVEKKVINQLEWQVTDKLLEAIIYFSLLDLWARGNENFKNKILVFNSYKKEISDIKKELFLLAKNSLNIKNITTNIDDIDLIRLNPIFKKRPPNFKYIDADLIIGDSLINIETKDKLELNDDMWEQLIGYLILCSINNIEINKVGVYFSNYNYLYVQNLWELYSKDNLYQLVELVDKDKQYHNNDDYPANNGKKWWNTYSGLYVFIFLLLIPIIVLFIFW